MPNKLDPLGVDIPFAHHVRKTGSNSFTAFVRCRRNLVVSEDIKRAVIECEIREGSTDIEADSAG